MLDMVFKAMGLDSKDMNEKIQVCYKEFIEMTERQKRIELKLDRVLGALYPDYSQETDNVL